MIKDKNKIEEEDLTEILYEYWANLNLGEKIKFLHENGFDI